MRFSLLAIVLLAAGCSGSSSVSETTRSTTSVGPSAGVQPEGFDLVEVVITKPDGDSCELCMWLADTVELRRRGLMFVTDLGVGDAMAFVYPSPHSGTFWMKNTPLPLSIVFFDPAGTYLEQFDMEPCRGSVCDRYKTPNDFVVAVEAPLGSMDAIGIVAGSVIEFTGEGCAEVG